MSNKGLPNVWTFLRLMVDPGWAPIAVAVVFLLLVGTGIPDRYDYVFHATGGASIAYFAWRTASLAPSLTRRVPASSRPVFALVVALAVAALWESAEFAADRLLGTSMQHGMRETFRDFAYGALGALAVVVVARLVARPAPGDQEPLE